jgi:hypothetical protein
MERRYRPGNLASRFRIHDNLRQGCRRITLSAMESAGIQQFPG